MLVSIVKTEIREKFLRGSEQYFKDKSRGKSLLRKPWKSPSEIQNPFEK